MDLEWAGNVDRRRSTRAYVFTLFTGAISWMRKQQAMVSLSTIEAEYMTTTHACKEDTWLKRLCSDIEFKQGIVIIYSES